jgi:hypothetical protein
MKIDLFLQIFLSLIIVWSCSQQPPPQNVTTKSQPGQQSEDTRIFAGNDTSITANNVLLSKVREVIKIYKLTSLSPECLLFETSFDKKEGVSLIIVREKHSKSCGGDTLTSPRLFTLKINTQNGIIWSDAKSLTGEFEKLK